MITRRWFGAALAIVTLVACGTDTLASNDLGASTRTSEVQGEPHLNDENSLLGYNPFGCPVFDLGAVLSVNLTGATIGLPWCTNLGILTTYCGIRIEDIAVRILDDGEIFGEEFTVDDTHVTVTYNTHLPGRPQAIFISSLDEPGAVLTCPNGETLVFTEEHQDIFMRVGEPTDLPTLSALLPERGDKALPSAETSEVMLELSELCVIRRTGASPEDASLCLYEHWKRGDGEVPDLIATPDAASRLFAHDFETLGFVGCERVESSYGLEQCEFVDESHSFTVQMYLYGSIHFGDGWYVNEVGFYGNPPGWGESVDVEGSWPNVELECPRENYGYIASDQAALCLYEAWVHGDLELATWYASEAAISWLWPAPETHPGWYWEGCFETGDPLWPMACNWFVDDGFHGVVIEMLLSGGGTAGFWVESIESFG